MNAIQYANTMTNPAGVTPFGPIAVRWSRTRRDWCAMNTIEKGWASWSPIWGTLPAVLGRLNVRVVAVKCDDHSMYFLCEPGAVPVSERPCEQRIELEVIRRPGNALNVEIGAGAPRCRLKPPANWAGSGVTPARWICSGGSPLVLGVCSADCPATRKAEESAPASHSAVNRGVVHRSNCRCPRCRGEHVRNGCRRINCPVCG